MAYSGCVYEEDVLFNNSHIRSGNANCLCKKWYLYLYKIKEYEN